MVTLHRWHRADQATAMLVSAYVEWCQEAWADDVTKDEPCPPMEAPKPGVMDVVFISDASARWLEEIGHEPEISEADCWVETGYAPSWWEKPRTRQAVHWYCCGLPDPRNSERAEELEAV